MELYIVRHGIAQEQGEGGPADAERALTPDGRRKARRAAKGLKALGCRPGRLATSPLLRAEQTARIMAQVLCPDAPFEECEFLRPGVTPDAVARWLKGLREGSVMIVGHMPDVAEVASGLLTKGAGLDIAFKKAAVCCISFDAAPDMGTGRLEWLLQPAQLSALADS
jgi:phosphohistidine phosphatase